jgi:hypothetical protein
MAFCTSENTAVLSLMMRQVHEVCIANGVQSPFSEKTEITGPSVSESSEDSTDPLDEQFICPPEWRTFLHGVLAKEPNFGMMPDVNVPKRAIFITDGAPAFAAVSHQFNLDHILCKMHLSAHDTVANHDK